jgi:hypothetical protein
MPLVTRFFSLDDLTAEQGWELLSWCRRQGADEFTLTGLVAPKESLRMRAFFAQLDQHARAPAPRRLLSAPVGESFTRQVSLWTLSPETESLLREAWLPGFVSREYNVDLWLEDLAVYRDGELMMAVLSHENGGVLRVTELELQELRRIGFPDRDAVPWVGY